MRCAPCDLRHKRVLVMGLGTKDGGVGAVLHAARRGAARIVVTDLQGRDALRDSLALLDGLDVELHLGGHLEADFATADVVIRNETVRRSHPLLRLAEAHGARIESPIGLFVTEMHRPFLGVTGTKGKSTATHLLQHLLTEAGVRAVAAGNNCVSPLRVMDDPEVCFVLELSAQQLGELASYGRSPHIAAWLNFFPDHMNSYPDLPTYRAEKAGITRFQTPEDVLVVPWGDPALRTTETRARRLHFAMEPLPAGAEGAFLHGDRLLLRIEGVTAPVTRTALLAEPLRVPHYLELALAAATCAAAFGATPEAIGRGLGTFPGLPHRFERLGRSRGVDFVNDSAASTPESVILALRASRRPVALILGGGGDKHLQYDELARVVRESVDFLVLFAGDAIAAMVSPMLGDDFGRITWASDMDEAVAAGLEKLHTRGGGTLLLSPGCCGWPAHRDMFVRGELFRAAVRRAGGAV